jgi:hypothetical protein
MALSEAFGFEERWLRLLLKAASEDPMVMSQTRLSTEDGMADAQHRLGGIGNRQVLALRDWAKGIGVVLGVGGGGYELSPFGRVLRTYDPGLEELSTFWAIHHQLCIQKEIWFYAHYSNAMGPGTFSRADLKRCLSEGKKTSDSVLEKKVLFPLVQTMKSTKLGTELGLLIPQGDDTYARRRPDERRLSDSVLAYVLVDWCTSRGRTTVHLSELSDWDAPGRYMGLESEQLAAMLRAIQDKFRGRVLSISRTAGLDSVAFGESLSPQMLLVSCYIQRLERLDEAEALQRAERIAADQGGRGNGRLFD